MPSKLNNKLKRLYLIVKSLQSKPKTREELINMLSEHALEVAPATFERDKKTLKEDFGIELRYDNHEKTYAIDMPDEEELAMLIQFLQFQQLATSISESLSDRKSSLDFIDFENEYQLQGIEYLDRLFYATKNHQIIKFNHRKFETPHALRYTLKPYLLKQYQSRWYVIGENYKGQIKCYGIDRIEDLDICSETFEPLKNELKQDYRSCIGVSGVQQEKQLVRLKFDISQKEYLEHLPLHHSQTQVEDTETHVTYEYHIIDNFEFRQHILKYGSLVQVVSPVGLAKQIKEELVSAVGLYD